MGINQTKIFVTLKFSQVCFDNFEKYNTFKLLWWEQKSVIESEGIYHNSKSPENILNTPNVLLPKLETDSKKKFPTKKSL